MAPYPGFLGPAYQSASYMADSERLVNFYLEKTESPSAPQPTYCLLPTPGFEVFATVPEGPIRGACLAGDRCFFVAGYRLYELFSDGTTTARGTLASNSNPATLCWNGPNGGQLFITSGDVGYLLTLATNVLTTVLVSGATMGAFLDGYFLALDAATATLRISNLLDGATWDPTQVAQRTAGADPWVAMTVIHREIWLKGSRTSEVWFNSGAFPFPFEPIPGAFLEQGTAAAFSDTRDVAPLIWVSENAQGARQVLLANGYQGQRISTHGIETALQGYSTVADAQSAIWQLEGHLFYVLVFPTAEQSWYYDAMEGQWGELGYWNTQTGAYQALRVLSHVYAFNQHLVGDRATGKIYRMGLDVYTDVDGAAIRRLRQPPRMSAEQKRVYVSSIQLVMDVGIGRSGTVPTVGVNPQVMLRTSTDGGQTFGHERWASAGKIGETQTRVRWLRCGQARNRVDQFVMSDPVPFRIVSAEIQAQVGLS